MCSTDGRTFKNECQLRKRACRQENESLKVAYRGHCQRELRPINFIWNEWVNARKDFILSWVSFIFIFADNLWSFECKLFSFLRHLIACWQNKLENETNRAVKRKAIYLWLWQVQVDSSSFHFSHLLFTSHFSFLLFKLLLLPFRSRINSFVKTNLYESRRDSLSRGENCLTSWNDKLNETFLNYRYLSIHQMYKW